MRIKVTTIVLMFSLFFCQFLVAPAWAAGMAPSEGIVGSTVIISGLTAGQSYSIEWDGTEYQTGTVPSGGNVNFTVPDATGGGHDVVVKSPTGTQVLSASFTVLPSMTIDPNSGAVGTSVTVTGTGFAAAESSIKITYDSKTVKTGITADDDGSWDRTFAVPNTVEPNGPPKKMSLPLSPFGASATM